MYSAEGRRLCLNHKISVQAVPDLSIFTAGWSLPKEGEVNRSEPYSLLDRASIDESSHALVMHICPTRYSSGCVHSDVKLFTVLRETAFTSTAPFSVVVAPPLVHSGLLPNLDW